MMKTGYVVKQNDKITIAVARGRGYSIADYFQSVTEETQLIIDSYT